MRPGEAVLVISHTFPPYKGIGGRRWAKFARALARRGHPVHVIHSAGGTDLVGSLWTDDVRVPGVLSHPLPQRYPTVLFKRPLRSFGEKIAYRLWSRVLPLLVKGNWYDKAVFWERQLLRKSRELIDAHGIRNVVVTGAPFRLMAHMARLKQERPNLNLVADFRDPWSWGHVYGHGALGPERERHERELEARVVRSFDRLISPAPAIVEHLRNVHALGTDRVVHLPHAIDPDEFGAPTAPPDDGMFRMIYAGSLYGAQEAEAWFDALLRALSRARAERPDAFARCRLDLYITGHGTAAYAERVKAAGLERTVIFHDPIPARTLFPRIAQADLVLIFIPTINKDFLGTKFNEIFFLRRPVLHIGAAGLVSSTITTNKLGASIRVEDLEATLSGLIARERTITVEPGYDLGDLLLDRVTERLLAEVLR